MKDAMVVAMEWFRDEVGQSLSEGVLTGDPSLKTPQGSASIYDELDQVARALESCPAGIFTLADPNFPYSLGDVLRAIASKEQAWRMRAGPEEMAAHANTMARIVERATSLIGLLLTTPAPEGRVAPMKVVIPQGKLRRLMERPPGS